MKLRPLTVVHTKMYKSVSVLPNQITSLCLHRYESKGLIFEIIKVDRHIFAITYVDICNLEN